MVKKMWDCKYPIDELVIEERRKKGLLFRERAVTSMTFFGVSNFVLAVLNSGCQRVWPLKTGQLIRVCR